MTSLPISLPINSSDKCIPHRRLKTRFHLHFGLSTLPQGRTLYPLAFLFCTLYKSLMWLISTSMASFILCLSKATVTSWHRLGLPGHSSHRGDFKFIAIAGQPSITKDFCKSSPPENDFLVPWLFGDLDNFVSTKSHPVFDAFRSKSVEFCYFKLQRLPNTKSCWSLIDFLSLWIPSPLELTSWIIAHYHCAEVTQMVHLWSIPQNFPNARK